MAESQPSSTSSLSTNPSSSSSSSNEVSSTSNGAAPSTKLGGKFWLDPEEYAIRKRLPPSLPRRQCDVYITNKTAFKAQLERCQKLISQQGESEIYLHSLGAAIPRALNLGLQLQKSYGDSVTLDTVTSTVELTDDFEPLTGNESADTTAATAAGSHSRYNSAVHIKVSYNPQQTAREKEAAAAAAQQEQ